MEALIAPLSLLLERWLGYSSRLTGQIGHPVMWFGALICWLESRVDRREHTSRQRRIVGVMTLGILLVIVGLTAGVIQLMLRALPGGWLVEMLLATPFLAQKELGRAVQAVATALHTSLEDGREAVGHIVGRDPQRLDEAGVSRAAIETLAENTSDGVVAPWFWLALLGLPGIALYKAINTADSMIGHLNERYCDYGWAAARLDDLVNLVPARLTAMLVISASFFVSHASPSRAWKIALRDATKHKSPNAGWPEAAFAGALGFSLGGPRSYAGEMVDLPIMGEGRMDLRPVDIAHALQLYRLTLTVLAVASVVTAFFLSEFPPGWALSVES